MASVHAVSKAKEALLQALSNLYADNETEPLLKDVAADAGYKGTEGKAIRTAIKQLKDCGTITKIDKDHIKLTDKGIQMMPQAGTRTARATNEDAHAQLVEKILQEPMGIPNEEQIQKIFSRLMDGEYHRRVDLAKAGGYAGTDSKPFRNLLARMEELGLVQMGLGTLKLTDVCFPRGRSSASCEGSTLEPKCKTAKTTTIASKKTCRESDSIGDKGKERSIKKMKTEKGQQKATDIDNRVEEGQGGRREMVLKIETKSNGGVGGHDTTLPNEMTTAAVKEQGIEELKIKRTARTGQLRPTMKPKPTIYNGESDGEPKITSEDSFEEGISKKLIIKHAIKVVKVGSKAEEIGTKGRRQTRKKTSSLSKMSRSSTSPS